MKSAVFGLSQPVGRLFVTLKGSSIASAGVGESSLFYASTRHPSQNEVVDSGIVCSGTIPFENEIKSLNVMQSHPHIVSIVHSDSQMQKASFVSICGISGISVSSEAKDIDTEMQALEAELFSSVLSSSDDAIGLSNEQVCIPYDESGDARVESIFDLDLEGDALFSAVFSPLTKTSAFYGSKKEIGVVDLSQQTIVSTFETAQKYVKCSPHKVDDLCIWGKNNLELFNLLTNQVSCVLETPHCSNTTAMAFNPSQCHQIATGGKDGYIRIWDLRNVSSPLLSTKAHDHWVTSLDYNRYDQLLLSSSSDNSITLWDMTCLSSTVLPPSESTTTNFSTPLIPAQVTPLSPSRQHLPVLPCKARFDIKVYHHHDESVYQAMWAINDPWTFASVAHDGNVVLGKVDSSVVDMCMQ